MSTWRKRQMDKLASLVETHSQLPSRHANMLAAWVGEILRDTAGPRVGSFSVSVSQPTVSGKARCCAGTAALTANKNTYEK